jgi:hypothetical protein
MSSPQDPVRTPTPEHDAPRRRAGVVAALAALTLAALAVAVVAIRSIDRGQVFHVAPDGAAGASGSSWDSAGTLADLPRFIDEAAPGDEVWIRGDAGPYQTAGPIVIDAGGSPESPVVVRGVAADGSDRVPAEFVGTRADPYDPNGNPGSELFKLLSGANHLAFHNLAFTNQGNGAFRVGADIANLTIDNVRATNVRRFFESHRSGDARTATISGLRISDVTVNGFSKGAIRLGDDTHDVVIRDVVGDSQRQDGDRFAMGVHLVGTVHDVLLERVTMRNSHDSVSGKYWNGDGFAAEGGTYALRFADTVATGSTDAGYDLKSTSTTLVRAVAEDNKRNFRFWGEIHMTDSTGRDPRRRGGIGGQAQVWAGKTAQVRIVDSRFTDQRSNTVVFEVDGAADVALQDTSITKAADATGSIVRGRARLRQL